jgi:molecular chaperone GrpE
LAKLLTIADYSFKALPKMEQNKQNEETKNNEETQETTVETAENHLECQPETPDESGQNETQKLQLEIAEQKDKYLRLYSEFENFRRRTAKEKLEMVQSANEQLIKSLLVVVDDFERAEKSFSESKEKDLEGFFLIHSKFKKVFDQYGVKVMNVGPGSDFDADLHEAITQIPAPEEKLKGKIVDVVEKGYLLNEKVIRFAKVVVGS